MDFNSRIRAFKNNNPKLKQFTLRISEEHAKKLKKIAKDKKIKPGLCLRLLTEFVIDAVDDDRLNNEKQSVESVAG